MNPTQTQAVEAQSPPKGQAGEAWLESVDELYRQFESRIYGCAHRMVSPDEVDDAVQEIALRMTKNLPTFRGDSAIGTWIYSVARHTCLDVRRRRGTTPSPNELPDPEAEADSDPERRFDYSIMACRAAMAIGELPPLQQKVVMYRLGRGLSTEETAAKLGVSVDSVKARLRRARSTLRESLAEYVECPRCGPGSYSVGPGTVQ